ncbi:hypothetical protein BDV95DRAFT_607736 [Massariosphaeria phaeospora]|uniref:Uncharacterized protein n=1 Tax=Massariosphaeria phaeospora TaxID=100035 RepID=A0A7C8M4Z2_9PLEO|nr:hypothetical protein BDV95DRAFT_607736 [Massariosphaeria phaeospora]
MSQAKQDIVEAESGTDSHRTQEGIVLNIPRRDRKESIWEQRLRFFPELAKYFPRQACTPAPEIVDDAKRYSNDLEKTFYRIQSEQSTSIFTQTMMPFALEETELVCRMTDGARYAFRLYIILKVDLLSGVRYPHPTSEQIRRRLDSGIQKCIDTASKPEMISNLGWACRNIRSTIRPYQCWMRCPHDSLYEMLDRLQRIAHTEIWINTLRVTNGRLPLEMVITIFEAALASEGIPSDPRVVVTQANGSSIFNLRGLSKDMFLCPNSAYRHVL